MQELQSLKNKILTLAIQGKLVPQEETDEPASVLLQKIQLEKERLIQEKKLKKDTVISSAIYKKSDKYFEKIGDIEKDITKEIPFEIPKNWQWVRLGNIFNIQSSKRVFERDYVSNGIPFYRSKEIGELSRKETIKTTIFISEELYEILKNKFGIPHCGDILITSVGTIGNTWICDDRKFYYKDGNIIQVSFIKKFSSQLVKLFFDSSCFCNQILSSDAEQKVSGTAYNALTIIKLKSILFPLPPLEEQERIVKKVQELFAQIDYIEKNNQELDNLKATFKNKMLSLAIQGKLVPQAVGDEPASVLLQKIQKEKEQLIKEKKVKKDTVFSTIYRKDNQYFEKIGDIEKDITKEIPFEIPASWEWVRLGDVAEIYTGNSISDSDKIKKYHNKNVGYNFIATKDVSFDNTINYQTDVIIPYNEPNFRTCDNGAVLLCIEGGSAGRKIALVDKKICFGNKLCSFTFFLGNSKFLFYVLQSIYFKNIFTHNINGLIGGVNLSKLTQFIFPLPPLAEQHRITQKIEKVFTLCEKL